MIKGEYIQRLVVALALAAVLASLTIPAVPALAIGVWAEGHVTRSAWNEGSFHYIEVDRINYLLMPELRVLTYRVDSQGIGHEEPSTLSSVRTGLRVSIKAEGSRIYDILISNQE